MLPHKWYIAGTGNMGIALGEVLQRTPDLCFAGWLSTTAGKQLSHPVYSITEHADQEAGVFLCIPDRFIASAAESLKQQFSMVIHCSGMQPLHPHCDAVCWPMQTFSTRVPSEWTNVPVFIESPVIEVQDFLLSIFVNMGSAPQVCSQEQRQNAHLAAVIANNFSNAMFMFASTVLENKGMNPELLLPIIKQTVQKLQSTGIKDAQTGPAIRNDAQTLLMQMELLKNDPQMQHLYREISDAIRVLFKK
jgi:predicted short-subunit dehydrogenase-like oxidoreductase (DUF2520 family)